MSQELNGTLTNSANLVGTFGSTQGGTTNYNDLVNKPSINHVELVGNKSGSQLGLVSDTDLSTVAFSGNYNDLMHKPTIPAAQVNSDWNSTTGVSEILNKPTIPTKTSDLTNDSGFIDSSDLSTVATTGDYDDLINKPTIPAAQVNSDWNSSSGVSEILNKPTLSTVATSGSYNDLTDKPTLSGTAIINNPSVDPDETIAAKITAVEGKMTPLYNKYNCAGIQYCLARNDGKCQFTVRLNADNTATSVTWNKSSSISVTIYGSTNAVGTTATIDNATISNGVLSVRLSLDVTLSQYTQLARGFLLNIEEKLLATVS